jgi:transglutaminase-like putative cysteine protease
MIYSVRHVTKFRYKPAVRESLMEVRMQPRSDEGQRCLSFSLDVRPAASVMQYRDFLGNIVHHFDIAASHAELTVKAQSLVDVMAPRNAFTEIQRTWDELDQQVATGDYWEMMLPSVFARPTPLLEDLASEMKLERRGTPLELMLDITKSINEKFAYVPNSTGVDSPIDDALSARKGVCQDFAHIMIALARKLRIPCRYVSGYLFHAEPAKAAAAEGASHAWVEALLPGLGWTEFDPTNNVLGGESHIRVAVGRDYAEVPPTRGVFKGGAESELSVSVSVALADAPTNEEMAPTMIVRRAPPSSMAENFQAQQEQEQQQQ